MGSILKNPPGYDIYFWKQFLKMFDWEKSTISFERSILFFSLISKKTLKTEIFALKPRKPPKQLKVVFLNYSFEVFGKKGRKETPSKNNGVYFLPFFQKNTLSASNWLLKIAKNQVFTINTRVRTHFPNDCERCYEVLGVTIGHYISQIDGILLV